MVTGILTPSLESQFTYPPELKEDLLKAIPEYHIFRLSKLHQEYLQGSVDHFCERMAAIIENRVRVARFLFKRDRFDLFMVQFQASDPLQHALWAYLDPVHKWYDPQKRETIFRIFYRRLDEKIKELRELYAQNVQSDFLTLVVSDHGFENHIRRVNLGNWLCQNGFITLNPRPLRRPLLKRVTKRLKIGKILSKLISQRAVGHLANSLGFEPEPIDWDKTQAYSLARASEGYIYVLGDTPEEIQQRRRAITEKLLPLRDPATNQPVVKKIYTKEEIYHGEFMERMPDLVVDGVTG
jgi:predicted AlkP superfamily phosphohydrolase/phosphomutase